MKRLIFRLSSLGDVILAQSALESPYRGETHWVVAKEFESLVRGNPKIAKAWTFDRSAGGLGPWIRLLAELKRENFIEVLDLHSTLRTRLARVYFYFFAPQTRWRTVSKERFRRVGYELLKRFWPVSIRPRHFAVKCARQAGGTGQERPDLRWMLDGKATTPTGCACAIAVVPASAWRGKEWPTDHYVEWIRRHRAARPADEIILFGTSRDVAANALSSALLAAGISFRDEIGKYDLTEVARRLAQADIVVGADTGLLHLAEAVGTPVVTLFGPTRNDFGFGPLDPRSRGVHSGLWCSPCSKDGSLCFRPFDRYACLNRLAPEAVERELSRFLPALPKSSPRESVP